MSDPDSSILQFLIGHECWGMIAGPGGGSIIQLLLGAKIPRTEKCRNEFHGRDVQENDGEFRIMVWGGSWRLISQGKMICSGAWSSNEKDGPMLTGLAMLLHKKVTSIDLRNDTLDLDIGFEGNILLSIFNDYIVREGTDDAGYWINAPGKHFAAHGLSFVVEERGKVKDE